ncbi:DNA translocase FtsK [Streptococcus constellatus subsp. pharyngis]|uniref:DNA translocase FtsK n=1 Tax=Streptococcus constellatus subsp. pharyngis SK1060 = CCUG 46377 TaxID=1035184 RepID=F9P4X6_STRCV|nr:DNA translocase FtsK [Streptococcus constellatus]AGU72397.1 putative cell division protein [Streptococcus constellatus subsp. pharyngis C232]AGU74153.1 putative cell division protein [Streptococcus constellatus subsp. pharyngis C818]AGU79521.1 putative cell division protein [Streptococcus constellatus subsp. pharyngis C1050]EGV10849.1 FtsK/SpoIIIE family protein [Streptococcus constellatus subsp. pharyngis SK1060 = CCUG 46377]QQC23697.1 DNA translocase FtsK [Streptococcus constellatus]
MANKKNSRQGRTTRRPTKAELERQKAIRRMLVTFGVAFLLLFAALKWGAVGITLYNLIRLLVGSLAYMAIIGSLIYLFFFKWVNKHEGYKSGFFSIFIGFLLIFQAYFVNILNLKEQVLSITLSRILTDLSSFKVSAFAGGGLLGAALYAPVAFLFSNIGSYFIGVLLILLGFLLISPYSIYDIFEKLSEVYHTWNEKREAKRQQRFMEKEEKAAQETMNAIQMEQDESQIDPEMGEILNDDVLAHTPIQFEEGEPEIYDYDEDITEKSHEEDQQDDIDEDVEVNFTPKESFDYKLPTINLFAPDKPKNQSKEKKIVRGNIKILEETFASFGIRATVERAEIGPSVTKYEVKPAVGVRVNRISNLSDDLALALAAKDVRIEAPIPGKSLVGIEVPNSEIAMVTFRELWEQSKTDDKKLLEIPLGKAVNGSVRTFDLAKMPHLLVAGSTGSGKSVAVNGIIASILMKARPDEVKFMMVDPKMVELSVYNDIPHLLIPVVTNPRKASRALQKVVDEMENRYELFSKVGARNIAGYNAKVAEYNASQPEYKQIPLPLIVVIVDELADLMMVASKEVEDAIIRLGQKARAAGIHMILATQRPSVDVISGLIKANVPSRIAFAVSSGTDSRTILDENGAEKLLGRGDMLFKPIDENHPVRLQGSFISDEDVEHIVTFVKNQAEADYDDNFDPGEVSENDMDSGSESEQGDPLFEEAKALVIETQKASASMLQRRLSVGFNRATRLMEELEAAGVIGPAEGTKPRKVLLNN